MHTVSVSGLARLLEAMPWSNSIRGSVGYTYIFSQPPINSALVP